MNFLPILLNIWMMASPEKYKAMLVEKCFSQVQGVDYHETFAPVAKMDFICLVLANSASKHLEVHHMDVKSTFLHGDSMRRYT